MIRARFRSNCWNCGYICEAGTMVNYDRKMKVVTHQECGRAERGTIEEVDEFRKRRVGRLKR